MYQEHVRLAASPYLACTGLHMAPHRSALRVIAVVDRQKQCTVIGLHSARMKPTTATPDRCRHFESAGGLIPGGIIATRHTAEHRGPAPRPAEPTDRWSMDFVHDALANGRPLRVLTVFDQWRRQGPIS